MEDGVN